MSDRIFQDYAIEVDSVGPLEFAAEIETEDEQDQQSSSALEASWDLTYSG